MYCIITTNEFRLKIAEVNSGRSKAAGSGNLKALFDVWLTDPIRRTYPNIDFCENLRGLVQT
jgi:hypothetical protein